MVATTVDEVFAVLPFLAAGAYFLIGYGVVYADALVALLVGRNWSWSGRWYRYPAYFVPLVLPFVVVAAVASVIPSLAGFSVPPLFDWLPTLGIAALAYALGILVGSAVLGDARDIIRDIIDSSFPPGGPIVYGAADVYASDKALAFLDEVGGTYEEVLLVLAVAINSWFVSWYLASTFTKFTDLSPAEKQLFLEKWMQNPNLTVRSMSQIFKALGCLGYYTDPRVWEVIGYPGPFVPEYPSSIPPELKIANKEFLEKTTAKEFDTRPLVDAPARSGSAAARVHGVTAAHRRSRTYALIDRDRVVDADVCIVGSGAGGAVLARELSRNPKVNRVVVLERGSYLEGFDFNQHELEMLRLLWRGGALTFNRFFSIFIGQGETLGGTTVINHAICIDTPRVVLDEWRAMGVGDWITDPAEFRRCLDEVKTNIHVKDVAEHEINGNNRVLRDGAAKYGISENGRGVNPRNCLDCKQCGFDHLGCHYDTKQSTLVTYLPQALGTGKCSVYCDTWAERVLIGKDGLAEGVDAVAVTKDGTAVHRLRVKARLVVVAAGAIGSSALLLRSRVPDPHKLVGTGLAIHPSPLVIAHFQDRSVLPFAGIPMSYHVHEDSVMAGVPGILHDSPPVASDDPRDQRGGFMIEAVFPNLAQFAAFLPGMGAKHKELMTELPHYAAGGILIRDTPKGKVSINRSGEPIVDYALDVHDKKNLSNGIRKLTEIYFHAGADKVMVTFRRPLTITREEYERTPDHRIIRETIRPDNCGEDQLFLGAVHPQGGNRLGTSPTNSVVDEHCVHHSVRNLVVCDASVFPTAAGVNPMLTIMGVATRVSEYLNANWEKVPNL